MYVPNGVAFVRSQNVYNDRFSRDGLAYIGPEHADQLSSVTVEEGDVLLNITGDSVARVNTAPADILPARVSQHVAIIRPDPRVIRARYLQYFLRSRPMQDHMLAIASSGGTRSALTKEMIEGFEIPCPSTEDQEATIAILGALDDKIELNHEMNRTLEATARAIFKSWFERIRDFVDVVPAQELIDIGALVINDGYRAKRSELAKSGLPFARAGNVDGGFSFEDAELLGEEGVRRAGDKLSRPLDIVFTSKGTVGRFAVVSESTPPFAYSPQLCFWRSLEPQRLDPQVLFSWMQDEEFLDQIDAVKGQTDMADYVSLRDQRHMLVPNFLGIDTSAIGDPTRALRAQIDSNIVESRTLADLRDLLLPKLLSGEIRAHPAERAVDGIL